MSLSTEVLRKIVSNISHEDKEFVKNLHCMLSFEEKATCGREILSCAVVGKFSQPHLIELIINTASKETLLTYINSHYKSDSLITPHKIKENFFEKANIFCDNGEYDSLKKLIRTAQIKGLLDSDIDNVLAAEEGYLGILAASKGYKNILEILFEYSTKIKDYQDDILNEAARYGKKDCVEFLIIHGADPKVLLNTTSYNSYPIIKELFDQCLKDASYSSGNKEKSRSGSHSPMSRQLRSRSGSHSPMSRQLRSRSSSPSPMSRRLRSRSCSPLSTKKSRPITNKHQRRRYGRFGVRCDSGSPPPIRIHLGSSACLHLSTQELCPINQQTLNERFSNKKRSSRYRSHHRQPTQKKQSSTYRTCKKPSLSRSLSPHRQPIEKKEKTYYVKEHLRILIMGDVNLSHFICHKPNIEYLIYDSEENYDNIDGIIFIHSLVTESCRTYFSNLIKEIDQERFLSICFLYSTETNSCDKLYRMNVSCSLYDDSLECTLNKFIELAKIHLI